MNPERLVRQHAADVFHLCLGMVRDRHLAEDLAQDAFVRAFAALPQLQGPPRPWLLQIARNRCLDHLRREQRGPWSDAPEIVQDGPVDDSPLSADLLADRPRLARALSGLPEQERAIVVLRFVHGFEYTEIAETFGIRPGAARMRVSRALARLREELQPRVALRAARAAAPAAAPSSPFGVAECSAAPAPPPSFAQVLSDELRAPAALVQRLLGLSRPGGGA